MDIVGDSNSDAGTFVKQNQAMNYKRHFLVRISIVNLTSTRIAAIFVKYVALAVGRSNTFDELQAIVGVTTKDLSILISPIVIDVLECVIIDTSKTDLVWYLASFVEITQKSRPFLSFAATKPPTVDIEPKGQVVVRLEDSLRIMCTMGSPLQICRVEIQGESSTILSLNQTAEDGIKYYGEGTHKGQCGVHIFKVKEKHNGIFKCALTPVDGRTESYASVDIVIAKPPNNPELQTSQGHYGRNEYQKGEKLEISCSASDPPQPQLIIERFGYVIGRQGTVNVTVHANPKPRFLWRVNGEKIEEGRPDESNRLETSTAVDLGNGSWLVVLTIDSVQKSDTEKEYILEAHNIEGAYEYHIVLSTSPEPAGVDLDAGSIIGIVVGALVLILIVFLVIFARATGRWCFAARRRGDEEAADGVGAGSEAHITPADDEDEDQEDPRIIDEKIPQGGQENPIHASTDSDTESAGRYSRTEVDTASSGRGRKPKLSIIQLFRRNKDKVSGADTDTMRTVVTVDDEKLQPCEQQQQQQSSPQDSRINPSSVEGGIVYAELDLTQQQQGGTPRRLNEDKTEYAEILYTKPETTDEETPDK
ncbi:hypothetical protein M0804_002293 [Polistes exclamans]|nr:hypothetical protein M0804_002293 [Polistes exclamans]